MVYLLEDEASLEQVQMLSQDLEKSLSQIANLCAEGNRFTEIKPVEMGGLLRVLENTAHIMTTKIGYLIEVDLSGKKAKTA